jgi:hypothetical protein
MVCPPKVGFLHAIVLYLFTLGLKLRDNGRRSVRGITVVVPEREETPAVKQLPGFSRFRP